MAALNRNSWPLLGVLFDSPAEGFTEPIDAALAAIKENCPEAAACLQRFLDEVTALPLSRLQELHSATFDLTPSCAPYVSFHLFGEEDQQRSQLMTGLLECYAQVGFDPSPELPDHIGVLLCFAPQFNEAEWADMINYVLDAALEKMVPQMEDTRNPYGHLLNAIQTAVAEEFAGEKTHA